MSGCICVEKGMRESGCVMLLLYIQSLLFTIFVAIQINTESLLTPAFFHFESCAC